MAKISLLTGFLLCLSLCGPALAQPDDDRIAWMENEGWKVVQKGVLQRQPNPGEIETFVYGVEGFTWKLRDLRAQLRKLKTELDAHPTPELRQTVASHHKAIASTREMIEHARPGRGSERWDGHAQGLPVHSRFQLQQ